MPARIPKACRVAGCRHTTTERHGYCIAHADKAKPFSRGSAGKGRGGRRWRQLREQVKQRDKGLCQQCLKEGKIKTGGFCDHIVPKSEGGTDALSNLQMLCKSCHDSKTHQESQRARQSHSS